MAITINTKIQIESDASAIYLTDITGAADGSNPNGYGAPNEDRNEFAGVFYATTEDSSNVQTEVTYTGSNVDYNGGYANTHESAFTVNYKVDGWYNLYYFLVSSTVTAVEGAFYYDTGTEEVKQIVGGLPVVVTDYSLMIGAASVQQNLDQKLFISKLAIVQNSLLEVYLTCTCGDGEPLCEKDKLEYEKLKYLLAGADYRFASGATATAQEMVEKLTKIYL